MAQRQIEHRKSCLVLSARFAVLLLNQPSVYVAVNFLFQLIFVFPLFLGMVMYANEFETKEKQKLTEIKDKLQHILSMNRSSNNVI